MKFTMRVRLRLVRERRHVEHEIQVLIEGVRNADGHLRQLQLREILRFGLLHPALELAHGLEIVDEHRAVARAELLLQRRPRPPSPCPARCRTAARAPCAPPANRRGRTGAGTACAGCIPSAAAWSPCGRKSCRSSCSRSRDRTRRRRPALRGDFQRRERRVLADVLRGDLVRASPPCSAPGPCFGCVQREPRCRNDRVHRLALAGAVAEPADDGHAAS